MEYISNIYTETVFKDEQGAWFVENNFNYLCFLEHGSDKVEMKSILPTHEESPWKQYKCICKWKNLIVVAPWLGKSIVQIYDTSTGECNEIILENKNGIDDRYGCFKFASCFSYNDYVYLVGIRYPAIVQIHMPTLQVEYITEWIDECNSIRQNPEGRYLVEGVKNGELYYFPLANAPIVVELDMKRGKTKVHVLQTSKEIEGFNGIEYSQGVFWLVDRHEGLLFAYNESFVEICCIDIPDPEAKEHRAMFAKPIVFDEKILLSPVTARYAFLVDAINHNVEICTALEQLLVPLREIYRNEHVLHVINVEQEGVLISVERKPLYFFEINNDIVKEVQLKLDKRINSAFVSRVFQNGQFENDNFSLTEFLYNSQYISLFDEERKNKNIGKTIHEHLK